MYCSTAIPLFKLNYITEFGTKEIPVHILQELQKRTKISFGSHLQALTRLMRALENKEKE